MVGRVRRADQSLRSTETRTGIRIFRSCSLRRAVLRLYYLRYGYTHKRRQKRKRHTEPQYHRRPDDIRAPRAVLPSRQPGKTAAEQVSPPTWISPRRQMKAEALSFFRPLADYPLNLRDVVVGYLPGVDEVRDESLPLSGEYPRDEAVRRGCSRTRDA